MQLPSRLPRPTLTNSIHREPVLNFTPPMPFFPPAGITPPHPHPVAPFPPPPQAYGTLQHGPVAPAPTPLSFHHRISQLQPFYSFAMTHLPPNIQPRPLPHTLPTSPYHSSLFSQSSQPLTPQSRHTIPASNVRRGIPSSPNINHPTSAPSAVGVSLTCSRCGHCLVVDLSGCGQFLAPLSPPSVAGPGVASFRPQLVEGRQPQLLKQPVLRPQPSHPLQMTPPHPLMHPQPVPLLLPQPVSLPAIIRPVGRRGRRSSTTSTSKDTPRSGVSTGSRVSKKKSHKVHEVVSQSTARIMPYRERKKEMSVEVYARQQLELEFAFLQKPTLVQIAELSSKLCMSKEFVRQWFSGRRETQRQQTTSRSESVGMTIPSGTHDITLEVVPAVPVAVNTSQNATVFVSTMKP